MANNVFGNPITNSTLEGMPEYSGKTITRVDRARVAMNMKNAGEKDFNARTYVEKLKEKWGTGVSTLGLIYNATGDPLTYAYENNWYGHIGPDPYPITIANGQWGAFLHVKRAGEAAGSNAAVVYRGKKPSGDNCDRLLAWSNPWNRAAFDNKVYLEARGVDHFKKHWVHLSKLLNNSNHYCNESLDGCFSTAITGSDTSPILEAQFTLTGAVAPEAT